ncbi:MAG TPA: phospholipase D-like domain-containing protein [Casimicrobiaceae bacterium]|nr:phospholipase D-like domain-containing protein [Casimicrobiaceae bacterium]
MPAERRVEQRIERLYDTGTPQFYRSLGVLLGPPTLSGNRVQALQNGEEIFPAMLAAIKSAQRTITFETYIYWSGEVGRAFADALSERARAGVRVHVLLDWVGSQKIDAKMLESMRAAGIQIELYRPLHWYHLTRINNRTHRKLLVIDGRVGFTGGVGIADKWGGHAQDEAHWRDSHYRAEGPVVAQMQATFLDNWTKVSGEVLHGPDYFPAIEPNGDTRAQMFSSSPEGGADSMQLMYLMTITAATRTIDLATAYFVPDELTVSTLVATMKRGVRLRVIVPGPIIDTEVVQRASRATWGPLLEAGAEIYEYQPTMYHCKVMIVDRLVVSVGSTNFDRRSFRLNDEANLNVYDSVFATEQSAVFERDITQAKRITLAMWQARPLHEKLMERAVSIFAPQL